MMKLLIFFAFVFTVSADVLDRKTVDDLLAQRDRPNQLRKSGESLTIEEPVLSKNATQKLLFIVHRHGERTLAIKIPDEYALNASYWPDGDGQLTIPGKLRMYNLGLYFKERYQNFLTSNVRELKVRSSGLDRCIESAQLVVFGMYPPQGRWLFNKNITQFQPVPISSTIPNTDPMINPHCACTNAWKERASIMKSEYAQKIQRNNQDLYDFLSEHVGLKVNNIEDAKGVFDALIVEQQNHIKLPNWTSPIVLSRLEKLYDETFFLEFMTRTAQMFRTGVFINELQTQILKKLEYKSKEPRNITKLVWDMDDFANYKTFIYSSHDSFISALLVALGNFDYKYPPYGSAVIFEVYQNDVEKEIENESNIAKKNRIALDNTFIKFFYLKHTETKEPIKLRLSNCKHIDYCSFKEFFTYTEDIIITEENWRKKCDE